MQSNIRAWLLVAVLSLCLGLLIGLGWGWDGGGAPGGTVEGYVVHSQTGAPVQNAYVYVPTCATSSLPRGGRQIRLETYTDAQGHFAFPNFPADLAVVVVVEPPAGFDPTPLRLSYGQTLGQLGTLDLQVTVRPLPAHLESKHLGTIGDLTDIIITPGTSTVAPGEQAAFSAELVFGGTPPATLPKVTWSTEGGVGLVDPEGVFKAGTLGADGYVVATLGSVVRRAHVVVQSGTPPQLSVAPTSLDFGSGDTQKTVTVTNPGGGTLLWSIWPLGDPVAWLTFTPRSGSLEPGQSTTARLTAWRIGLAPGSYATTLRVSSNWGSADLAVTMTVLAPRILFESDRDENREIYVMDADGSGQTNLTRNAADDWGAVWSPDRTKIAFGSARDGNQEIYVMDADGSGQTNLTRNAADDWGAVWSPDGTRIAFESGRDGNREIYVMNADGSAQTNLTQSPELDGEPAWSPDGTKIAFRSARDGDDEIYAMNADGSGQANLTQDRDMQWQPVWSPDGTKIAFASEQEWNYEIYVMNADGSGKANLTQNPGDDFNAEWFPDGTKIVFESGRDGNSEIYVMNADGSGQTNLTNNPAGDWLAYWRP